MVCAFLAVFCALLAAKGATCAITRCSAQTCFTFHPHVLAFEHAANNCVENGGHLMTIRDDGELREVQSLLALAGQLPLGARIWIGLKLTRGDCVTSHGALRGFRWITDPPDSAYSNWNREPIRTCTERCVVVSSSSGQIKWHDVSCKSPASSMCMFNFQGMCKSLQLAGAGGINYTVPYLKDPLGPEDLDILPHGTFAEINCAYNNNDDDDAMSGVATCIKEGARFVWTSAGPFCTAGRRGCRNSNGGCEHLCSETNAGEVWCRCKDGYELSSDKVSCLPKDACLNSPCEHECHPGTSGALCACRKGFELSDDGFSCVDLDECTQDVCHGHLCHNRAGSYECECRTGYKDVEGKCEDIDECAKPSCAQKCLNSEGSFSCYCAPGFAVYDGTCKDVDECLHRPCDGLCTNTHGSFVCSCNSSYHLDENGISCVPDVDQPAVDPTPVTQTPASPLSTETTTTGTYQSVHRDKSLLIPWVLVYVLASVVPLLALIVIIGVIASHRWNRSRKKAKKKSSTADSYCWVASAYSTHIEGEQNIVY